MWKSYVNPSVLHNTRMDLSLYHVNCKSMKFATKNHNESYYTANSAVGILCATSQSALMAAVLNVKSCITLNIERRSYQTNCSLFVLCDEVQVAT
jgi:hypothetical protein